MKAKLSSSQMLAEGIREGLTTSTSKNWGQLAGERCYELAVTPGLDSKQHDIHSEVVHLCSIADIVSSVVRKKEPWIPLGALEVGEGLRWENDAYLEPSGEGLRRILCVGSWNEDRHYAVCHSWGTLGTMCLAGMSMKVGVVLLGQHRDGRYHGPWSKGLLHPVNKKIRFRKKTEGRFKDSWIPVWREDRDDLSTKEWLSAMLDDGVLESSLLLIDIPLPDSKVQKEIRDRAARQLKRIYETQQLAEKQLSTCFWPRPCEFQKCCHSDMEPNGRYGFVRINGID